MSDRTREIQYKWLSTMKFKEILENHETPSEEFLSEQLKHTPNPSCIVGNALIVHFGYVYVTEKLLKLGLLQPYELIKVAKDIFHMTSVRIVANVRWL